MTMLGVRFVLDFNESVYKRISNAGTASIVVGIIMIVISVVLGTLIIVHGGKLLSSKKYLID